MTNEATPITMANQPSRAGKGIMGAIPADLAEWNGPLVVYDPKPDFPRTPGVTFVPDPAARPEWRPVQPDREDEA